MRIDDLKYRVRTKIDELGSNDSDMIDIDRDNKQLDVMIEGAAVDGLRYLLLRVPLESLKGDKSTEAVTINSESLVGTVNLPADFLRLKSVRLSSWSRAVSSLVPEDSAYYLMQNDAYACGIPERPVAALIEGTTRQLELYKAASTSDTLSMYYIPIPKISKNTLGDKEMDVDVSLEEPLVYVVSSMVMQSYKDFDLSAKLLSTADTLLGL